MTPSQLNEDWIILVFGYSWFFSLVNYNMASIIVMNTCKMPTTIAANSTIVLENFNVIPFAQKNYHDYLDLLCLQMRLPQLYTDSHY